MSAGLIDPGPGDQPPRGVAVTVVPSVPSPVHPARRRSGAPPRPGRTAVPVRRVGPAGGADLPVGRAGTRRATVVAAISLPLAHEVTAAGG